MKKAFYASLFYEGVRGGAIVVNDYAIVYKNQTLTLPSEYKNIVMPFADIDKIESGRALLFPTFTIYLRNGKFYKYLIFNRKRFYKTLQDANVI